MAETILSAAERRRSLAAAISCTSVVGMVMGLTWPLLSLILESRGVDSRLIGLSSAAQALAIFLVSPIAPWLVARFGMVRTMSACLATAVAALLLPLHVDVYAWFPIRLLLGAGVAILFIVGETWVVQVAAEDNRGRVVGLFGFVWAAGFAAGPLVIRATGIEGWTPFLAGVVIILAASLPLPFASDVAPAITGRPTAGPLRLVRFAPAALLAMPLLGLLDVVNDSFLPLYGLRSGLDQPTSVTMTAVLLAGVTLSQLPIGWLADRVDGRRLLAALAALVLLGSVVLPAVVGDPVLRWPVLALWGAAIGGIWTVSLVLVGARFRDADLAAVNTARGALYGLGSVLGPALAGFALDWWDPHGIPLVIAVACLAYLAVALIGDRAAAPPA